MNKYLFIIYAKKIINIQNKKFENICLIKQSDRLGKDYKYDMDTKQTQKN